MIAKAECRVVLDGGSPKGHSFVEGLTTLKEKMLEIDYAFGTITYLNLLANYLQDEYLFDIEFYGEHKNTPNVLYFMTGYETGSVKFEWLEEMLDYYKSGCVKIVLCSSFGLIDEFTEEDMFLLQVLREDIEKNIYNLLKNQKGTKINYTESNIHLISMCIDNVCKKYLEENDEHK